MHRLETTGGRPPLDADDPVFSLSAARELLGFPLRAVGRHRALAWGLFGTVVGATVLVAVLMPRHWVSETKLIADRNVVMPALDNPRRAIPTGSDTPTRLAAEAVLKHDNLVEIIHETNLLATWPKIRSPMGRLKGMVMDWMGKPMSDADRMRALIGMLEQRLYVKTDDGTVTIGVDWLDPQMAYRLVSTAEQNFLEQRHATEDAMITESISILEHHVTGARQEIEESMAALKAKHVTPDRTAIAAIEKPVVRSRAVTAEIATLRTALRAKHQMITDLETSRSQRVAALQTRLAELRNSYGPAHPEIANTQESIRALSSDSPQLATLRTEEAAIRSRLVALGASPDDPTDGATAQPELAALALERLARAQVDSAEDPEVAYARSRLKIATTDYEDMLDRLQAARIELETARAAFKYRFDVVNPPEVPKHPSKPQLPVLLIGGLFMGVLLAVFGATAVDVLGGRVLEPWQVSRQLGLPVVGDVHAP
ncbi:MAG TPA: hypothetical protein VFS44_12960 [Gemmatimonadaceae bacterium]|nr:hypothetical protein [Gemmatimonadaceae bacterium]